LHYNALTDVSRIKRDGGNAQNENMTEAYYSAFQHSPEDQVFGFGLFCFTAVYFL